jgi:hypothetical protein
MYAEQIANKNAPAMMIRKSAITGFLMFSSIILCEVYGQWTSVNAPGTSFDARSYFEFGHQKFIGTTNGLYSSGTIDGDWKYEGSHIFTQYAFKGDSLLYQGPGGLIYALDLNDVTRKLEPVMNQGFDFSSLMVNQGRIFMTHEYGGFYMVNQTTREFVMLNTGLPRDKVWFSHDSWAMMNPVNSAVNCGDWFIASTWHGLYRASVNSVIWQPVGNQAATFQPDWMYASGQVLFGIKNNKLYRSVDYGETLTDITFNLTAKIQTLFTSDNTIYIGTEGGGIFSKNENESVWNPLNSGLSGLTVNFIRKSGSTLVCGTTTDGFHYLNSGGTWVNNNSGEYYSSNFTNLKVQHKKLFAWNDVSLNSSADQGRTWKESPINFTVNTMINNVISVGNTLVVQGTNIRKLICSQDDGETWIDITGRIPIKTNAFPGDYIVRSLGTRLFMSYDFARELYYTDDLGLTWTDISFPAQFCNSVWGLIEYKTTTFAFFCHYGQVARLINNQWVLTNTGLPVDQETDSFYACGDRLLIKAGSSGWYIYDESTSSWSSTQTALDDGFYWNWRHLGNEDYFYYFSQGWVISNDCMKSISPMNTDGLLNTADTYQMVFLNDTLYLVQGSNGIWKRPVWQVSAVEEAETQPDPISVYPNPAGEYFSITGLPNNLKVDISLMDLTGRIVCKAILSQDQRIDTSGISPGIYFVQIRYGGESVVRKIMISR